MEDYSGSSRSKRAHQRSLLPPTLLVNMDGQVQQTSSPRLVDSHHNTSNVPWRTYPAIIHALVACALISPIAFLPYFAARRHINALQQSVKVLTKKTLRLRNELDVATSIQRSMTSELRDLREMAHNTSKLSNETHKKFDHRETERLASHEAIQSNLRELFEDSQHSRYMFTHSVFQDKQGLMDLIAALKHRHFVHLGCLWPM